MYIPLIGRLSLYEWPIIVTSFLLAWIEYIVTVITKLLPAPVIALCTSSIKFLYNLGSNPVNLIKQVHDDSVLYKYIGSESLIVTKQKYNLMTGLLNARNIHEMCLLFGYQVEDRIVQTQDGYILTLHRIARECAPPRTKGVIYLHHGLLMNSEIWVTMLHKHHNLPYVLFDLGYDVWLGNNRGNKYSQKHLLHKLTSDQFWDFSIDEFALFDIPDSIEYILDATNKKSLTYVGFSQGTAQAFASLSINPQLNTKVDQIIAISPATTPHGLYSKFLDILLKSSPNVIFLLFSRRVLMPSVAFWQRIMYPPLFNTSIDVSNYILFNWRSKNISYIQKLLSYAHLYSTTSVKTVVHWFQIIGAKNFQMYHDATNSNLLGLNPVSYPLKNIRIPIHLIYGDSDSLVDINLMQNQLPSQHTTIQPVHNHEHLDNLWGRDVPAKVFKYVLAYLGEDEVKQKDPDLRETVHEVESISDSSTYPGKFVTMNL